MDEYFAFTWLIALPLVATPLIYLAGRLNKRYDAGLKNPSGFLALVVLLATCVPFFFASKNAIENEVLVMNIGNIVMALDGIGVVLAGSALLLGIVVTVFSFVYMGQEENEEKFYALLTAMIGTIIGLGSAGDLFNMWVWFEAMAISSYMLVAFYRTQPASLEAGVKYLVQSAAGSVMVVLGIAMVFAQTGILDLGILPFVSVMETGQSAIAMPTEAASPLLLAAAALLVIGFGVKASLVPMHTWLPDAHSMAPSGISAMLSGVVIEAGLVAMLRAVLGLAHITFSWWIILTVFAALNILVGNLMALRQTQVKRLLAYSSISHVGYMLVGLAATAFSMAPDGASGSFFHVLTHALMKGLAFLGVGALLYTLRIQKHDHSPLMVNDLDGAARRYPLVAFCLSVALLGLGGLPPLAGFMSKWWIFVGGFRSGNFVIQILVIFAALNSVLSLGYYAPLINRMYRHEPGELVLSGGKIHWSMSAPLVVLMILVVALGFYPSIVSVVTNSAAYYIMTVFGFG